VSKVLSITQNCCLRLSVETCVAPKGPLQCKGYQYFGHTQRNCGYAPLCVGCGGSNLSGWCSNLREQHQCCGWGGNHTANYRGCVKGKDAMAAFSKQAPKCGWKSVVSDQPAAPKPQRSKWACRQNHHHHSAPNPNPSSQPVTEATDHPIVTAISKTARSAKPQPKPTAAHKPVTGKPQKKAAVSVKNADAKPTTPNLVVPTQNFHHHNRGNLWSPRSPCPPGMCGADSLTLRAYSSLPTVAASPRAALKTVILFVAAYSSTH